MPIGRDFEIALRYLDGDLPEAEQMCFEIRLSEDPELERQFQRLAKLDTAHRRLAESGAVFPPEASTGRTALLVQDHETAPGWRNNGVGQLVLAASLLLFCGAASWRLLGAHATGALATTTPATGQHGQRSTGPERSLPEPTGESPLAKPPQLPPPRMFACGVSRDGSLVRLVLADAGAAARTGASQDKPTLRRVGTQSAGEEINRYIEEGNLALPPNASELTLLIAGTAPENDARFLELLNQRVEGPTAVPYADLLDWLVTEQGIAISVFEPER